VPDSGDKLSEIARVPPWPESLAARHAIPSRVQFAMDLCLEEVLSNSGILALNLFSPPSPVTSNVLLAGTAGKAKADTASPSFHTLADLLHYLQTTDKVICAL